MIRIAVFHARYTDTLSYYDDWLDAFCSHPGFEVVPVDICRDTPATRGNIVHEVDALVLLHSTNADSLVYLAPWKAALESRTGSLLVFPGNEVNLPGVRMADRIDFLRETSADIIASQLLPETARWLYSECASARVMSVPHALNPNAFRPGPPHAQREFDLVARSYAYPPYLGDNDRQRLFDTVAALPLKMDIDGVRRLTRPDWAALLSNGRGTVSTEAGSFYLEKDDATVLAIREYLLSKQSGKVMPLTVSMQKALSRLPKFVRHTLLNQRTKIERLMKRIGIRTETAVYQNADFQEIFDRFFAVRQLPPVYGKCISSRHFDAAGTETCQLLVRGRYNDILRPDEHYLALDRDLGNLNEALRAFADDELRTGMTKRTRQYLLDCHTYHQRMRAVEDILLSSTHDDRKCQNNE